MSATDINTALSGKANASTTYTKTETDNAISVAVADKADADDVTKALSAKADVATTYSKTAVDDLLSAQASTLNASAPNPYTVSVGKTTTSPSWISFAPNSIASFPSNNFVSIVIILPTLQK